MPGGKQFIHFLGREESSPLLEKKIEEIRFPNSIGLSGKVDPLLSGTKAFSNLGFGFIEIGPVTMDASQDSIAPVVHHQKQMIEFPSHLESIGLEQTRKTLLTYKRSQPTFIRLAGTASEQFTLMNELEPFADFFVLETEGDTQKICKLLTGHKQVKKPMYLAIPVDHYVPKQLLHDIQAHTSGIVLDEGNEHYLTTLAAQLKSIHYIKESGFTKPIVTVGGVHEPENALQLFEAGAELIMLSDGYVFSGPGLPKRIKEAQLAALNVEDKPTPGWSWYWLFGFSILVGGLIALLLSMSSIILPYDEHFLGMDRNTLEAFNERILYFMAHDRMTLAGTMISGGIMYMFLARYGIRTGLLWAKQATDIAAILGFLGILLFIGYGYFDWLHLLFWVLLSPFYLIGFIKTRQIQGTPSSHNKRNHHLWRRSLIGQLAFVILGFSFVLGGIIISYIGITNVFVATDLLYICMPPEMLDAFNERLIPVIAHDRAGFGSALLSVGFLVLLVSLWGFHQGNRWVWWSLLIGGIPAFTTGIIIHFAIGYTTFLHLLPAYFTLALFLIGLVTTYHFFHMTDDKTSDTASFY